MPLIKEMKYIDNGIWENQFNEKIKRRDLPFCFFDTKNYTTNLTTNRVILGGF